MPFGVLPLHDRLVHALEQIEIVLVAIGLEIEIGGNLAQPLVADALDVLLHEAVVVAPANAGGAHRRLLGAGGDLVGVQVMQAELVDQRLLDLLVQDQKSIGVDLAAAKRHRARHVAVDIDGLAVVAVAGEIGDVVLAVEVLDPAHHRIERAVQHQARHVPLGHRAASCAARWDGNSRAACRHLLESRLRPDHRAAGTEVQRRSATHAWNEGAAKALTWVESGWSAAEPRRETTLSEAPQNPAGERLLRTIDTIEADVALIELWACALSGFAQPAPDYGLGDKDLGDKFRRDGTRNAAPKRPEAALFRAPRAAGDVRIPAFCEAISRPLFLPAPTFKFIDKSIY